MKNKKINQKGVSLIIVIFTMTIMIAIVLTISTILLNEIKILNVMGNSVSVSYPTDTGIERTLYFDTKNIPIGGTTGFCNTCNVCAPGDCNSCTLTGNDCNLITCGDCTLTYNSTFNGKTYTVDATRFDVASTSQYPMTGNSHFDSASYYNVTGEPYFEISSKGSYSGATKTTYINNLIPNNKISWNHTVTTSGSNRILIVGTATRDVNDANRPVTSVTYGGQSLTKLREDTYTPDPAFGALPGNLSTGLWYKVNPLTGNNTIVVNFTGNIGNDAVGMAVSLVGINQATPVDTSNTASGGAPLGASVPITTSYNNDLVVDVLYSQDDLGSTPDPSQTLIASVLSGVWNDSLGMSIKQVSLPSNTNMTWTWPSTGFTEPYLFSVGAFRTFP